MLPFQQLRIIFIGTPDFAVACLAALVEAKANIVAVITAPDKPAGRGMHLHQPAVKQYAVTMGIPVLQPPKLKHPDFLAELAAYKADIQVVVAFRMLPEVVWNMPRLGTYNVHASLLPQYRGAAPINYAIINGETETGVTTFKLRHEIDTGDILLQKKVPILPEDNAGTLHDKLMHEGAGLMVQTIQEVAAGTAHELPQAHIDPASLKHAYKIFKEHTRIRWEQTAQQVHDHIRGLAPYPTAYTLLGDKSIKVYAAHYALEVHNVAVGTYNTDGKTYLRFATTDGWVYIDELQQEGKKRMDTVAFLRGFRG
jgi:methionyl-tRNA formyltransferase